MPKRSSKPKRPTDTNQLARAIVDLATSDEPKEKPAGEPSDEELAHAAAVALGRLGGKKGGPARAKKLSKKRRAEIAKRAARARWDR